MTTYTITVTWSWFSFVSGVLVTVLGLFAVAIYLASRNRPRGIPPGGRESQ